MSAPPGSGFANGDLAYATYHGGSAWSQEIVSLTVTQIQAYIKTRATERLWSMRQLRRIPSIRVQRVERFGGRLADDHFVSNLSAANTTQTLAINGSGFTPGNGLRAVIGRNGSPYYYPALAAAPTPIQAQIDPGRSPEHAKVKEWMAMERYRMSRHSYRNRARKRVKRGIPSLRLQQRRAPRPPCARSDRARERRVLSLLRGLLFLEEIRCWGR